MKNRLESKNMERQVFIIPPVICKEIGGKKLSLFRVKKEGVEEYQLELDENVIFKMKEWQIHVLNALFSFGGDTYKSLLLNTNERFGLNIKQNDVDLLLDKIRQHKLFDDENAPKHPITKPFYTGEAAPVVEASGKESVTKNQKEKASEGKESKTASVSLFGKIKSHFLEIFKTQEKWSETEAEAVDDEVKVAPNAPKVTVLFNPTNFLNKFKAITATGRYLLYPLPLFLAASIFILGKNPEMIRQDLPALFSDVSIVTHILFGLITVSAVTTFATASVAYAFTATVKQISVLFFFGFIPRFIPVIEDTKKFSRNQKLWLHATPLLARIGLFCVGVIAWYNSRHLGGVVPDFFALLAVASTVSFFVASCPFYKSTGYRFLTEFFNEPYLWGKAVNAFLNKINRNVYTNSDNNVLVAYAMTCILFTITLIGAVFFTAYQWFEIEMGEKALFLVGALFVAFCLRVRKGLKEINEAYHRNLHFERWREGVFPIKPEVKNASEAKPKTSNKKKAAIVTLVIFLMLPYNYEPSGQVIMIPMTQQQVSTDIAGIVDEVYYDGGEFLKKGTVIAKLSINDYQAQLNILQAKLEERSAYVEQIKSSKSEQITIAEEALESAKINAKYSGDECARQRPLHKSGSISQSEMAKIERVCTLDKQKVVEAEAELQKASAGSTAEEIRAAELSLLPIQAEIALYQDRIARSHFSMPFDGRLATLHLKEIKGRFLEKGALLAMAQDDTAYKAELKVPESDLAHVKVGANVNVKTSAYPDKTFKATIATINPDVEEIDGEKMVTMIIAFTENENLLKSGLSGFAKVDGGHLMVWEALTRSIYRFITIDLWAWVA